MTTGEWITAAEVETRLEAEELSLTVQSLRRNRANDRRKSENMDSNGLIFRFRDGAESNESPWYLVSTVDEHIKTKKTRNNVTPNYR